MKKKLAAIGLLFLAVGFLSAQTPATGTGFQLTIDANAAGTGTIQRAPGNCPATGVPASGTTLSTSVSVIAVAGSKLGFQGTYSDSGLPAGNYCYWSTLAAQGGGSGVSNTFLGSISVTVTLSGKPQ